MKESAGLAPEGSEGRRPFHTSPPASGGLLAILSLL